VRKCALDASGSYEHGNKLADYIKGGEVLE
jgi:hypothetical protein